MTENTHEDPVAVLLSSPYDEDLPVAQEDATGAEVVHGLAGTSRDIAGAIAWGRRQIANPTQSWLQLCLSFVRQAFGLPAVYPSAKAAWEEARRKHHTSNPADVPRGVPAFYRGGTFWHVVLTLGDGLCLSNDVRRRGRIDVVRMADITKTWGYPLVGWTEDLNARTLPTPPRPAPPLVRRPLVEHALEDIAKSLRADHPATIRRRLLEAQTALQAIPRKK